MLRETPLFLLWRHSAEEPHTTESAGHLTSHATPPREVSVSLRVQPPTVTRRVRFNDTTRNLQNGTYNLVSSVKKERDYILYTHTPPNPPVSACPTPDTTWSPGPEGYEGSELLFALRFTQVFLFVTKKWSFKK